MTAVIQSPELPVSNPSHDRNMKQSKDLNVELLRIIACLMVIMIHVRPFPFSVTTLRDAVVFINVMNGPAVAAFFLISGFFISKKQTLSHVILRFLRGVILPTAVFVFCLGLIRPWIDTPGMGLLQSILNSQPLFWNLNKNMIVHLHFGEGVFNQVRPVTYPDL